MDLGLHNKVALVTAASQGIGLAVARRLLAEGANVAISSRDPSKVVIEDDQPGIEKLKRYATDFDSVEQTEELFKSVIADHGRLDILVLNTPGPKIVRFLDTSLADWAAAYDRLMRPCLQLAHAAAHQMVKQGGGSIVFLTSTWVKQPAVGGVLSASIRSALSALSKQMSLELAPLGVRVNQIQPGATATGRMQTIVATKAAQNGTTTDDEIRKIVADIPAGRWGEPEEIADAVTFIVSSRANFITGATLQIDGGAIRSTI
jgi:3-oxoacyl-[acyl-carrier protein] reductase